MNKYFKINLQTFAEDEEKDVSHETTKEENKDLQKEENNVSRETLDKNEIDYSDKFDKIDKGLKNINSQLKLLNKEEEEIENNDVILFDNGIEKYLTDNKNKKLSDYDVYKKVLNQIEKDEKDNKNINIPYKFIEFMKAYCSNHDSGVVPDEQFKKQNIEMKYPVEDYFKNQKIKIKKD